MVKQDFQKYQYSDLVHRVENAEKELGSLVVKIADLEMKMKQLEPLLDMKKTIKGIVQEQTETITDSVKEKAKTMINSTITEKLHEFERLKNQIESEKFQIQKTLSTKIDQTVDLDQRFSNIYATLGVILCGPIGKLQKVANDLEMVYNLKIVYSRVVQPPMKLYIQETKNGFNEQEVE